AHPERDEFERAERAEDLLDGDRAQVAEAEDLPRQLALPAGEDDAAALDLAVERLPVEVLGHPRGRDGLRGDGRVREELEAEGGESGPRGRGAGLVAGEDGVLALLVHQAQALVDLVDDRDRRGE